MSEQRPIGDLMDARNVTAALEDADLVTDVLVLLKVVNGDGDVTVCIGSSEGTDTVNKLGLVSAAEAIINDGWGRGDDE